MALSTLVTVAQLAFVVVIGLYFWSLLKGQRGTRAAVGREGRRELVRLRALRGVALTVPLAEKTRPAAFTDIVGQDDGIRALRAALCGPNPQHVLLYGPPGVGKTAAARLVLDEAKRTPGSPFRPEARLVELDATVARFDERGIADPLIGSVHDPIYQGAGPLGLAGIPQPKAGAVTKAHGGVLFIDEIGELHPSQLNRLLKVLEDRRVQFESAYYSRDDENVPPHIHDIFEHGLPADFRLIGATTRQPEEIPSAIRSRCLEIFFAPLTDAQVDQIARRAAAHIPIEVDEGAIRVVRRYCQNGRDAVNLIQIAAGLAQADGAARIRAADAQWVADAGQYVPRPEVRRRKNPEVGSVYGLAVYGPNLGAVMEVEAVAVPAPPGRGRITVTGVIEEEELGARDRKLRRRSMARNAAENVLTALRGISGPDPQDFDIHINFPGGTPVDGPSAGAAMAVAVYSAVTGHAVRHTLAVTGEVSIRGGIRPVGGIAAKVRAAGRAGLGTVVIPCENEESLPGEVGGLEVLSVDTISELIAIACKESVALTPARGGEPASILSASPQG